jgi:hypothetical protein
VSLCNDRRRRDVGLIGGLLEKQVRIFSQDVTFTADEAQPLLQRCTHCLP